MALRVHHLNCGSMCPPLAHLVNERGLLVCHCLLIEGPRGLVLVDTGMGTLDCDPRTTRITRLFKTLVGARLDPRETALAQVRGLGFDPADVRDIVVTHLDLDHAGGLSDFPRARVHIDDAELAAALKPTFRDSIRYIKAQWSHGADWRRHKAVPGGERWFGFDRVRDIAGLGDDLLMIPLPGHSAGHAGVAVRSGDGWLLHAGDAYFHHSEITDTPHPSIPIRLIEAMDDADRTARLANQIRLRELAGRGEVRVMSAHDPIELEQAQERAASAAA